MKRIAMIGIVSAVTTIFGLAGATGWESVGNADTSWQQIQENQSKGSSVTLAGGSEGNSIIWAKMSKSGGGIAEPQDYTCYGQCMNACVPANLTGQCSGKYGYSWSQCLASVNAQCETMCILGCR